MSTPYSGGPPQNQPPQDQQPTQWGAPAQQSTQGFPYPHGVAQPADVNPWAQAAVLGPYGTPPPPPPKRSRRVWWIAAVVVLVLAASGGVTAWLLYYSHKNSDPVKITALIGDFATAVSTGDPRGIASYLCSEEAKPYLDDVVSPPGSPATPPKPAFDVGGVVVRGDVASATLTFKDKPASPQTLYFRKEGGKWTVCAPAKAQF